MILAHPLHPRLVPHPLLLLLVPRMTGRSRVQVQTNQKSRNTIITAKDDETIVTAGIGVVDVTHHLRLLLEAISNLSLLRNTTGKLMCELITDSCEKAMPT